MQMTRPQCDTPLVSFWLGDTYHSTFTIPASSWWFFNFIFDFLNFSSEIENFLKFLHLRWANFFNKKTEIILHYLGTLHRQALGQTSQIVMSNK